MFDFTEIRAGIRSRIGDVDYQAWFEHPKFPVSFEKRGINDQTLVIWAASNFFRDWIVREFGSRLHVLAQEAGFKRVCVLRKDEAIPDLPASSEQRADGSLGNVLKAFSAEMREREQAHWKAAARRIEQKVGQPEQPPYAV